jgi:hypothetical protein
MLSTARACNDVNRFFLENSLAFKLIDCYCHLPRPRAVIGSILDETLMDIFRECCDTSSGNGDVTPDVFLSALTAIVSAVCLCLDAFPLGVKRSCAALVYGLHKHPPNSQSSLVSVAPALAAVVVTRCVIPYTVEYGTQHPPAQQLFLDIASALQSISEGNCLSFSFFKRSVSDSAARNLSSLLHSALLAAFDQKSDFDEEFHSSATHISPDNMPVVHSPNSIDNSGSIEDHAAARHFVALFISCFPRAIDGSCGSPLPLDIDLAIAELRSDVLLYDSIHSDASSPQRAAPDGLPHCLHWNWVSSLLIRHPALSSVYEHLFPNISESGAAVESVLIVLSLGTIASAAFSRRLFHLDPDSA